MEESLRSVNLFNGGVADKQAGKYSGGMKRRLSVAISLIGDPKVCYLLKFFKSSALHEPLDMNFQCTLSIVIGHFARLSIWTNRVPDWIQLQEAIYGM